MTLFSFVTHIFKQAQKACQKRGVLPSTAGALKKIGGEAEEPDLKGQYYLRTGSCNQCGRCCSNIYLVHDQKTIETVAEFNALKRYDAEYAYFKPVAETANGLLLQCVNLQPDNRCGVYEARPDFCKRYPMEDTLLMGGTIAADCSYQFTLLKNFTSVLSEMSQKSSKLRHGGR